MTIDGNGISAGDTVDIKLVGEKYVFESVKVIRMDNCVIDFVCPNDCKGSIPWSSVLFVLESETPEQKALSFEEKESIKKDEIKRIEEEIKRLETERSKVLPLNDGAMLYFSLKCRIKDLKEKLILAGGSLPKQERRRWRP